MKKITPLFIILAIQQVCFSQPFGEANPSYRIAELQYSNSSGERGTTYFQYDHQDRLFKALWSLDDKSRYSINYYEYNSEGNLVSAFRDFSDGITSCESFYYDKSGNKISEHFYRSDSVSGSASYTYIDDQLIRADFKNYKGWLNGRLELHYNSKNQKETGLLYNDDQVICTISFEYDSTGNLVNENWDFNGNWSQIFKYVYVEKTRNIQYYSSPYLSGESNYIICKEQYTFNNDIGGPSFYYYNTEGKLERKEFIRSDSLVTNTYYNYDHDGRLVSSERIYPDSSTVYFFYSYDERNKLIKRDFYIDESLHGFESYLYNSDGELIKAYLKNSDDWLNGFINFKSNGYGKVNIGEFTGEDGFDATIIFVYNEENLVYEINWNFSFNKFQKYSFEYKPVKPPLPGVPIIPECVNE